LSISSLLSIGFPVLRYFRLLSSLFLLGLLQVLNSSLTLLRCEQIGDRSVSPFLPSLDCDSNEHKPTEPVAWTILIGTLALPWITLAFLFLQRRKNKFQETKQRMTGDNCNASPTSFSSLLYQVLSESFSQSRWYWYSVLALRQFLLVSLASFYWNQPQNRFLSFVLFHALSALVITILKPYRIQSDNTLEVIGRLSLMILSALLGMTYNQFTSHQQMLVQLLLIPVAVLIMLEIVLVRSSLPAVKMMTQFLGLRLDRETDFVEAIITKSENEMKSNQTTSSDSDSVTS
jgi:hypothetical protein